MAKWHSDTTFFGITCSAFGQSAYFLSIWRSSFEGKHSTDSLVPRYRSTPTGGHAFLDSLTSSATKLKINRIKFVYSTVFKCLWSTSRRVNFSGVLTVCKVTIEEQTSASRCSILNISVKPVQESTLITPIKLNRMSAARLKKELYTKKRKVVALAMLKISISNGVLTIMDSH